MSRVRVMLAAAVLATASLATERAMAAAPVGHTVKRITVPGTLPQEVRTVLGDLQFDERLDTLLELRFARWKASRGGA